MDYKGMDISIDYSSSFIVEEKTYKLRQYSLSSITASGHRIIEQENMFGQRILVGSKNINLPTLNTNDEVVLLELYEYFEAISISYKAKAVGSIVSLMEDSKICAAYYAERRRLLALIGHSSLSIDKKQGYINVLESLIKPNIDSPVTIPGFSTIFAESSPILANKWTNGPYYDINLSLIAYKKLTI